MAGGIKKFKERFAEIETEWRSVGDVLCQRMKKELGDERKSRLKEIKNHYKWLKKTLRRFDILIKMKPNKIYISTDSVFDDDHPIQSAIIYVKLPYSFFNRRLENRGVFIISTPSMVKYDIHEACNYGFKAPPINVHDNKHKFDLLYLKTKDFNSEKKIVGCAKVWFKIFYPELADRLVYEEDV